MWAPHTGDREKAMQLYDAIERDCHVDGDLWAAVMGTAHPVYVDSETIVRAASDAVNLDRVILGRYSQADLIAALLAAAGFYVDHDAVAGAE